MASAGYDRRNRSTLRATRSCHRCPSRSGRHLPAQTFARVLSIADLYRSFFFKKIKINSKIKYLTAFISLMISLAIDCAFFPVQLAIPIAKEC